MSDFALRRCPIFLAEILAAEGGDVSFAPLRCYTKDAPTILCASTRPCELHTNGPNLQELLPPTRVVEWAWRTRKTHKIGVEPPSCDLVEVPEMAATRHLSTLSTKGRYARLLELVEGDRRIVRARHVRELARQEEAREARCRAEFEQLEKATARAIREWERRNQLYQTIDESFAKTKTPAGVDVAVLLQTLGRVEAQMGRLEKQQALLLEAQEGHYEDVEKLEGTVEQAIEKETSVLADLDAGSQQARLTSENILAVAKAARDTGVVLLGFGGLALLLGCCTGRPRTMQRQRQKPPRPRQHQRKNWTQPQQRSHRQLQHQRKPRQRLAFERWSSAATRQPAQFLCKLALCIPGHAAAKGVGGIVRVAGGGGTSAPKGLGYTSKDGIGNCRCIPCVCIPTTCCKFVSIEAGRTSSTTPSRERLQNARTTGAPTGPP